jgi:hypothetical protein
MTWYNIRALANEHALFSSNERPYLIYSDIEHESGELKIRCSGLKSGKQTLDAGFSHTRTEYVRRGATFTVSIEVAASNAFPQLKCGRDPLLSLPDRTRIVVRDVEYMTRVLSVIGETYSIPPHLSTLLIQMFDDWLSLGDGAKTPKTGAEPGTRGRDASPGREPGTRARSDSQDQGSLIATGF